MLEQILSKTDGVPLFVEELTKSILESAALQDAGDRWEYAVSARSLAIPPTLRDLLMARLDRFAPVKEIAQIGAAIGREFSYEMLAAVAPHRKGSSIGRWRNWSKSGLAFQRGTPPDADYTFKHALVQDAAYDLLLRRRRQELHGKIARVIEERLPNIEATEPELLAHHYTEAKQPEKAIPLWQKAGNLALKRMALAEAIAHLNKGMNLVTSLPHSTERDTRELDLRTSLGTAWMALKGWPSQEVWDSLHPALALADSLRRCDSLMRILHGHWVNVLTRGRQAESLHWVAQIQNAAATYQDPDLLIVGHVDAMISYFWLGELTKSRENADRVLALYSEERHGHLVGILNHDPKTACLIYLALLTWLLGYPDQAVKISDERDAFARRRGHPFDLGFALTLGAWLFDFRGEPDELLKRLDEADRLGRQNSLPFLTECLVPLYSPGALIQQGPNRRRNRIAEQGGACRLGGGRFEKCNVPNLKVVLAEGMARLGDLVGALDLINESVAQVERPGWEERCCYAEVLRIKGWLLSLKGDLEDAERRLSCLARLGAAPAGEIVGAAHRDQLRAADARPGAGARGLRLARAGLWLVHRGLRHQGPAGSQGAAGRIGRTGTARARRGYARRTIRVAAEPRHGHRGLAARPRIGAICAGLCPE